MWIQETKSRAREKRDAAYGQINGLILTQKYQYGLTMSEKVFPRSALKRPADSNHPGRLQTAQQPDRGSSAAIPSGRTQGTVEKWMIPDRGQRQHQVAQRALLVPESRKAFQGQGGHTQRTWGSKVVPIGQAWDNLSIKSHKGYRLFYTQIN